MPHSVHMKKNKQEKRYLNHSHLEQYEWLVYSDSKKGLLQILLIIFIPPDGRISQTNRTSEAG